jgi:hypothetical protein
MASSAESRPSRRAGATTHSKIEVFLAFGSGVVFLGVLLFIAVFVKNPEAFAIRIYMTVLAFAAAAAGAVLPGFMEVKYKTAFRAGGSLALFAIVYFGAPAITPQIVRVVVPTTDPRPTVDRFLAALENDNPAVSWALLPPAGRAQVGDSEQTWDELYKNVLTPLGRPLSRQLVGEAAASNVPGQPPGAYRGFTFRTKFANDMGYRSEFVTLRGNSKEEWEVLSYIVSPGTTS